MNKKIITILTGIIVLVGAFFFYQHSGKNDLKAEHTKYLALINDNHDFDGGIKRLETLDTDEGQEIFKNIKTEIKITKELKNIDTSLDNKDVDAAKKSLEKVDTLTVDNTFDKAIEWLKEDITNYDKAKKEIDEDKPGNISSIIDKYKFNHSALKAKLSEPEVKKDAENKKTSETKQTSETKTKVVSGNTASTGGIGDNDVIPAGSSYVFSGSVTDSTTYKEFRQTNAYQTIATNYVGFNASNADIKACLEWLIKKGREGAQTLPSTQEYKTTFGR
jgi:putative massive surface protein mspD